MTTKELLQSYVANRSETAFAELVARHIDLVYSAALRRVNGNAATAQDVTQAVFTELARHAPRLVRHASITGWLYTSTHYLAANAIRAEQRRRTHEQEASVMNQLLNTGESNPIWNELRPSLDEAMLQLSAADREAVLLRYFERLPLAQVGAKLGVSELAARKRVERALEKLHSILARRGITSTVAALAILLIERAVASAPPGLAPQISVGALAATAGVGGLGWALLKLAAFLTPKTIIAAGAAAIILAVAVRPKLAGEGAAQAPAKTTSTATAPAGGTAAATTAGLPSSSGDSLVLHIVADDSGKPVPGARIEYDYSTGPAGAHATQSATADEQGDCILPNVRKVQGSLKVTTATDGYADWVYLWRTDRQDGQIPRQYTIRMRPPVSIGGQVVNDEGQPVPGAEVQAAFIKPGIVSELDLPALFIYPKAGGTAITDNNGHWSMNRFAKEAIANNVVIFAPNHPGYATHPMVGSGSPTVENQRVVEQMLAGNYVYVLLRGYSVRGTVVDAEGRAVAGARVFDVGHPGSGGGAQINGGSGVQIKGGGGAVQTTSQADGSFTLNSMKADENNLLTVRAVAPGFTQRDIAVDVANAQDPLVITLQHGWVLRLKVTDTQGVPVTNYVVVIHKNRYPVGGSIAPGGGEEYVARVGRGILLDVPLDIDPEGRLEWDAAPDGNLSLMIMANGFVDPAITLQADGVEHQIPLQRKRRQIIAGTVRDGATRQPIDRFTLSLLTTIEVNGSPRSVASYSAFRDGRFQIDAANPRPNLMATQLRIEAAGYAPGLSRIIATNETNVSLDFTLQHAAFSPMTVLTPDGKPAAHLDIGLVLPWRSVSWAPAGLAKPQRGTPLPTNVFSTDDNGRFLLPDDDSILRVAAASADGCAVAERASLSATPTLQLQPFGRIEGTFLVDDKPAAGHRISLATANDNKIGFSGFANTTDAAGHFVFPLVPPGKVSVLFSRSKGVVPGAGPLTVRSGQTSTVSLHAYTMKLRMQWPQGITRDPRWQVQVYAISADSSSLPIDLIEGTEDNWTAQELPPGNYTVYANVGLPGVNPNLMGQPFYNGKGTLVIQGDGQADSSIVNLQPVP